MPKPMSQRAAKYREIAANARIQTAEENAKAADRQVEIERIAAANARAQYERFVSDVHARLSSELATLDSKLLTLKAHVRIRLEAEDWRGVREAAGEVAEYAAARTALAAHRDRVLTMSGARSAWDFTARPVRLPGADAMAMVAGPIRYDGKGPIVGAKMDRLVFDDPHAKDVG